ncbi:MAG: pyruvate dehydrogenase (acetyl-transferring) E1 component subunit alpha [Hyphomicrobiaceae bacterium]
MHDSGASAIATFSIPFVRHLSVEGELVSAPPGEAAASETLVALYRAMVLTRAFDEKAVALQRTGQLGTYASSLGQEAVGVGLASIMRPEDVLLPSFREQGAMLWRGVSMTELLRYWGGDERGSDFAAARRDFPVCIPVASQFPHAVGVALAMKMRQEARVAVAVGGDGATSKGDFYEALNIAGVWKLPAVFVVNNNQWAISVPRSAQTAAATLAQKAVAAGVPGVQVDGNDVIAVRVAMAEALERARSGEGPSLVEALTYRLADHTTADDARRYRDDGEVSAHWKSEPVARLRSYLVREGVWTKTDETEHLARCRAEIETAVAAYLATPAPLPTDMMDWLFAELPPALAAQRRALTAAGAPHA